MRRIISKLRSSNIRYRRAAMTAVAGYASRVVSICSALILVPLTINYLGEERFGLWMTLSSFVTFLAYSDFGVGIGMQNGLADCMAKDDSARAKKYVSSAFVSLIAMGVAMFMAGLWLPAMLPLPDLLGMRTELGRSEVADCFHVVIMTYAVGLPAGMIMRICLGYQRGYWAHSLNTVGRLLAFFGVILCIKLEYGLPYMMFSLTAIPFLPSTIALIFVWIKMPWLRPSLSGVDRIILKRIFRTAAMAFPAQVSVAFINISVPFLIAFRSGAEQVGPYAVTMRLLNTSSIIYTIAIRPLWPAYREAYGQQDWVWIRRTFRKSVKLAAFIVIPICAVVMVGGQTIIEQWTRDAEMVPSYSLLLACLGMFLICQFMTPLSVLLNGLDRFGWQAICGVTFGVIAVATVVLADNFRSPLRIVLTFTILGWFPLFAALVIESYRALNQSAALNR